MIVASVPGVSQTPTRFDDFVVLYGAVYPELAGYCFGLLGDRELAADTAQDAFVRLLSRVASVREPRPWLFMVATNICRDRWRRVARDKARRSQEVVDLAESPAEVQALQDLVSRLPDRLATVTVLFYYADLSVDEISRALRKPPGTIKRSLHEARNQLRQDYGVDDA